jgi:signal transduction histidine kinase
VARFLGPARAGEVFAAYAERVGVPSVAALSADAELVNHIETILAGTIGAASARIMVASATHEEALGIDEVMDMLDEASQVIAYSHELEQKSRELEQATAELREANLRLQELDRLKDDFVSTVSHELRTPLTSIRAFSEILVAHRDLDVDERARYLEIIVKESERLTRLINQVLDLSKLESGEVEWRVGAVDIREVVADSVTATRGVFEEEDVRLEVSLPAGDLPLVLVDRDRVVQVMVNLLSNAAKFCAPGTGWVDVSVGPALDALQVNVRDNGPGVRLEHQELIFDKFRQAGDPLTEKPGGTGLGLPISRQIITQLGGRLWVESPAEGGAVFSFTLPRAPVDGAALLSWPVEGAPGGAPEGMKG